MKIVNKILSAEKIADKIIKRMQNAGLTPEQMLKVLKKARKKYKLLKKMKIY